jgi:poly(A) polymerase
LPNPFQWYYAPHNRISVTGHILGKFIALVKNLFNKSQRGNHNKLFKQVIIPRAEHPISRKNISINAIKVLNRLRQAGFQAYLVGGGVRDLLLGREPKDFDVVTDALPEQVYKLFRNALMIGRRFRLVHVRFHGEIVEVATFRKAQFTQDEEEHRNEHGILLKDNEYGSLDDDVIRRDFTINALYYNIADFSIVDFVDGMQDLRKGVVRIIGEPNVRFTEDPVRILRAIRFAAKLGFRIEEHTAKAMNTAAALLSHMSPARIFDEVLKLLLGGYGAETFALLHQYNLIGYLFPLTDKILQDATLHQEVDQFLMTMLQHTDERLAQGKIVNPAFMFAALLWYPLLQQTSIHVGKDMPPAAAHERAVNEVLHRQLKSMAIPRRLTAMIREIWQFQHHLEKRRPHRILSILYMQKFRASYDFLLLRAEVTPELVPIAEWWTALQAADDEEKQVLIKGLTVTKKRRRRRKPKVS